MDLSHLLSNGTLDKTILMEIGFKEDAAKLVFRFEIPGTDLCAIYSYCDKKLSTVVYDSFDNEPYTLFEVEGNAGKFVEGLRYSAISKAEDIISKATVRTVSMKERTIDLFAEKYKATYDNPWPDDPIYNQNLVFRAPSGKWVGLIMTIPINRLGLEGEQLIDCINLKHKPEDIPKVIDQKTVFPAYHMNKKNWITVILGEATDWNLVNSLIEESVNLVKGV